MKAVILAGGLGTRIIEESHLKPKPMIEIGGMPIIWHIMKLYSCHGINDFVICAGYKGYIIKEYFANYFLHMSDVTFDMRENSVKIHKNNSEPWSITVVDTGDQTNTGGRIKRIQKYVDNETFCMTYGDGVSNVDIKKLVDFHKSENKAATLTAVQPPGRYGALYLEGNDVIKFKEKPLGDKSWINGGFFVLEPEVFEYIDNDSTSWELDSLNNLAFDGKLNSFKHEGFWLPMDTLRDKNKLEELWAEQKAPWKVWQ